MWSDEPIGLEDDELPTSAIRAWIVRNRETLRLIIPSYVALLIVLIVTAIVLGGRVTLREYVSSLLVLASFPAVIVFGQGIVILIGGLDLSVPWMISFGGVWMAGLSRGSDWAMIWTVPLVLLIAGAIGAINVIGIVVLGISPIVMTLAMNGILQTAALNYCGGAPLFQVPHGLHWLLRGQLFAEPPIVWLLVPFVIGATLVLTRTSFSRRLFAVGNSARVAELAGVPVASVVIAAYSISAICAALVGFHAKRIQLRGDAWHG